MSGYEFYKLCKWSYCSRYSINFCTDQVQEGDFVFLNLDAYFVFLELLKPNMSKFNLITHNSDQCFNERHIEILNYCKKVYAINCSLNETNAIQKIPIGFVDTVSKPHNELLSISTEKNDKLILAYVNFSRWGNPVVREPVFTYFLNKKWSVTEEGLSYTDFYRQLTRSKYVISPQGAGPDCHRVYESLLCDAIPIVHTSFLDTLYKRLPVLIVDDWDEVTESFLNESYDSLFNHLKEWKSCNKDWYKAEFWI